MEKRKKGDVMWVHCRTTNLAWPDDYVWMDTSGAVLAGVKEGRPELVLLAQFTAHMRAHVEKQDRNEHSLQSIRKRIRIRAHPLKKNEPQRFVISVIGENCTCMSHAIIQRQLPHLRTF